MALETPSRPPPFMTNTILNFHFDYWHPSLSKYTLLECHRWWDGYQEDNIAHQTVLLDDLHPKWVEKERLKNWADRFPFQAEYKGGCMLIRPARIVVTSNYTPEQAKPDFLFIINISYFFHFMGCHFY